MSQNPGYLIDQEENEVVDLDEAQITFSGEDEEDEDDLDEEKEGNDSIDTEEEEI